MVQTYSMAASAVVNHGLINQELMIPHHPCERVLADSIARHFLFSTPFKLCFVGSLKGFPL